MCIRDSVNAVPLANLDKSTEVLLFVETETSRNPNTEIVPADITDPEATITNNSTVTSTVEVNQTADQTVGEEQ